MQTRYVAYAPSVQHLSLRDAVLQVRDERAAILCAKDAYAWAGTQILVKDVHVEGTITHEASLSRLLGLSIALAMM